MANACRQRQVPSSDRVLREGYLLTGNPQFLEEGARYVANSGEGGAAVALRQLFAAPQRQHVWRDLPLETRPAADGSVTLAWTVPARALRVRLKRVAEGLGRVARNTPTLWNVAYNRWQFWDGRRDTLWAQSVAPIENVNEMGSNRLRIYWRVAEEPGMRRAYEDLFGSLPALDSGKETRDARPVAEDPRHPMHRAWLALTDADRDRVNRCMSNLGKAVEAFERTLITPEAAARKSLGAFAALASSGICSKMVSECATVGKLIA